MWGPRMKGFTADLSRGPKITLHVEEDLYTFDEAQNGADPMWCRGSTCLVRIGEEVFASGLTNPRHTAAR